jgi:hypothetical protein
METVAPLWLWATFVAIVLVSLFVEFVVLKKQGAHDIGVKEALNWSLIWIALSFFVQWLVLVGHQGHHGFGGNRQHQILGVPHRLPD